MNRRVASSGLQKRARGTKTASPSPRGVTAEVGGVYNPRPRSIIINAMHIDDVNAPKKAHYAARGQNVQDPFLNAARKARIPVSIYLINGVKLQGRIDSFDQFAIVLRNNAVQLLYKHAISTIAPAQPFDWPRRGDAAE